MKQKEKCLPTMISSPHIIRKWQRYTYIRIQLAYKRGSCILIIFSSFYFFRLCLCYFFFSLFRSRLLYYFVIGLRGCFFFFVFFLLFFFILSCPSFTLFARFFPSLFCFSFLLSLFLLLTTQRGIRTLDFSTTKLENKRRNVSH